MAPILAFDDMYLDWRPNNAPVEAGLPTPSVWATSSGQPSVDDVVLGRHQFLAIQYVGRALPLHPPHGIAAGRSSALCAKDGVVTPEEGVGLVYTMPRVTYRDVDAPSIAIVH